MAAMEIIQAEAIVERGLLQPLPYFSLSLRGRRAPVVEVRMQAEEEVELVVAVEHAPSRRAGARAARRVGRRQRLAARKRALVALRLLRRRLRVLARRRRLLCMQSSVSTACSLPNYAGLPFIASWVQALVAHGSLCTRASAAL